MARQALLGQLAHRGTLRARGDLAPFQLAEAAVKLLEGHATAGLEAAAAPAEQFRTAGHLLGSLRAALVTALAELARRRPRAAREALAAGVLERFTDLPDVPAVRRVLALVSEHAAGRPDPAFLDHLDLWLILAEDSPGISFPDSPFFETTRFSPGCDQCGSAARRISRGFSPH